MVGTIILPKQWYQWKKLLFQWTHVKHHLCIKNVICEKVMPQDFYSTNLSNLQINACAISTKLHAQLMLPFS